MITRDNREGEGRMNKDYRGQDVTSRDGQSWMLGQISTADLDFSRGILALDLSFNFGGMHQGFGGICLDTYSKEEERRIGHAAGTDALIGIMSAMGVERWSDLRGKLAWAIRDSDRLSASIVGIARPAPLVTDGLGTWLLADWRKRWFSDALREEGGR